MMDSNDCVENFIIILDHLGITKEPGEEGYGIEFNHEEFQEYLAVLYGDEYEEL